MKLSLSDEQLTFLAKEGYLIIPDVLSATQITQMQTELEKLVASEGINVGGNRLLTWQRKPDAQASWMRHAFFTLYTKAGACLQKAAIRWIFPRRPDLKDCYMYGNKNVTRHANLFQRIKGEIRDLLYTASVKESGALRVCNLLNKSEIFDICVQEPRVIEGAKAIIGEQIKLSSLNYRAAEPGGGLQPIHIDGIEQPPPARVAACNTLWLLDDLTNENGATRVVPGSHTWARAPEGTREALLKPQENELLLTAKAGSVILMNGHAWHGGTLNATLKRRRLVQAYFVALHIPPQMDQHDFIQPATTARLSLQANHLVVPDLSHITIAPRPY